ncbi:MAG: WD40 repeat domain-containing protein, partial [Fimbriimonadaceae bacterium]|nr:WD40 repeat domain-containing protein [Fimbriimonadaceae bacterium]
MNRLGTWSDDDLKAAIQALFEDEKHVCAAMKSDAAALARDSRRAARLGGAAEEMNWFLLRDGDRIRRSPELWAEIMASESRFPRIREWGEKHGKLRFKWLNRDEEKIEVLMAEGRVTAIHGSEDGRWLAVADTSGVTLWDREAGSTARYSDHGGRGVGSVFVSGDRIVSGGSDGRVVVRQIGSEPGPENIEQEYSDHGERRVRSVFVSEGRIVSAGIDGRVVVRQLGSEPGPENIESEYSDHRGSEVQSFFVSGDRIVSGGRDGRVVVRQIGSEPGLENIEREYSDHGGDRVWSVFVSGDRIVSGGGDGRVVVRQIGSEPGLEN